MSQQRRIHVAPPLSARDTAELEAFAQLLGIQHARRSPDAAPGALDMLEAALYPGGLGGDEPPQPAPRAPGDGVAERVVCALTRGGRR